MCDNSVQSSNFMIRIQIVSNDFCLFNVSVFEFIFLDCFVSYFPHVHASISCLYKGFESIENNIKQELLSQIRQNIIDL